MTHGINMEQRILKEKIQFNNFKTTDSSKENEIGPF